MPQQPRKGALSRRLRVPGKERAAPVTAILEITVLAILIPAIVSTFPSRVWQSSIVHWTLVATLALSGGRYAALSGSRLRRPHEMTTWLFAYLFLGLAPIVQDALGEPPVTTPWSRSTYSIDGALIALIGCLALVAGLRLGNRVALPQTRPPSRVISPRRTNILTAASLSLATYYILALGPSNLTLPRADAALLRQRIWSEVAGSFVYAGVIMGLLVSVLAQLTLRATVPSKSGLRGPVLLALTLAVLLIVANPISTARYVFGSVALAIAAGLGAYSTLRRFRLMHAAALVGMLVAFPVLDTFRYSLQASVQVEPLTAALTSGDFDAFSQLVNAVDYTQGSPKHMWLVQGAGALLFWVPRAWWPGKPLDTGVAVGEYMGYGYTNLSAPLWAEFFVNGGWALLILGMGAFGFWVRRADMSAEESLRRVGQPGILGAILPFYLLILLRGSLLQAMGYLTVAVVAYLFVSGNPHHLGAPRDLSKAGSRAGFRDTDTGVGGEMR